MTSLSLFCWLLSGLLMSRCCPHSVPAPYVQTSLSLHRQAPSLSTCQRLLHPTGRAPSLFQALVAHHSLSSVLLPPSPHSRPPRPTPPGASCTPCTGRQAPHLLAVNSATALPIPVWDSCPLVGPAGSSPCPYVFPGLPQPQGTTASPQHPSELYLTHKNRTCTL